ncbi:MAG: restriction endonuclease [Chloroflexi bacterium]|nr:restriction endonuclease [Chloroflexota bacterium]
MRNIWIVRAGGGGVFADSYWEAGIIAIGFARTGDISHLKTPKEIMDAMRGEHPNVKDRRLHARASQLLRFVHVIKEGDLILTPIRDSREIMIGVCDGPYKYESGRHDNNPHIRSVDWKKRIAREKLSNRARNSAGGAQTLFSMNEHRAEIESVAFSQGQTIAANDPALLDDSEAQFYEEVQGKAEELISDKIAQMDPLDFEELVAALLRSMGYFARRTVEGPDRGVDVIAQSDPLGFESPRIKVQVKQRNDRTGAREIREFIATLRPPDKGLYVSTGGYTREALYEAERAPQGISLTVLTGDEFTEFLLEYYDRLDPQAQSLMPLKKVFVPIE